MVQQRAALAQDLLDGADDLVHGEPLGARELQGLVLAVLAARGLGHAARDVAHEDRVDGGLAVADHGDHGQIAAEGHEAVHAAVARAVDPRGAEERELEPVSRIAASAMSLARNQVCGRPCPAPRPGQVDEAAHPHLLRHRGRDLGAAAVDFQVRAAARRLLHGVVRELDGVNHHVGPGEGLAQRDRVAREGLHGAPPGRRKRSRSSGSRVVTTTSSPGVSSRRFTTSRPMKPVPPVTTMRMGSSVRLYASSPAEPARLVTRPRYASPSMKKALVVEDDPDIVELLVHYLQRGGLHRGRPWATARRPWSASAGRDTTSSSSTCSFPARTA